MRVHGHDQPVNHVGHQVLPWLAGYCAGTRRHRPAVPRESRPLKPAAMAYPPRPGAAHRRTRTHRDEGNDAGFTINLPAMHDKSSCLGTVRSSCRSDADRPSGYAYGCAQITRFGTAPADRHSDLIADHNGGSARVISSSIFHSA